MNNRKRLVSILAGVMAVVLLLSLILGLIPAARAASSGEIRDQINDLKTQQSMIREEKDYLQSQYQQNEDDIQDLVARKVLIDHEIFLLNAEIELINEQISAFVLLVADKQDELDEAEDRYRVVNDEHRERIRVMEEEGAMSYWEVIFKAKSFADLLDRLNMIQEIAAADRRRLEALADASEAVSDAKEALETELTDMEATRQELDDAQTELTEKKQVAQDTLNELIDKAEDLESLFDAIAQEEEDLMAEIARKEQEYNDAKYQEWLAHMATATTATTAPATNPPTESSKPAESEPEDPDKPTETTAPTQPPETTTPPEPTDPPETTQPAQEGWIVPCSYTKLTSPFGYRDAPTEGASTFHQGVDLAGPEGTYIYAARSGTVTIARYSNSAGFYVTINHGDGFSSVYMHMTSYTVKVGQKVSQGQHIGYMGSTGISTGSHLHFGISLNGTYVNPANYVPLY